MNISAIQLQLMRIFLFFCLLSAGTVLAQSQYVTIKGIVLDAATGEPLPQAAIQIKHSTAGTAANMDGVFFLSVSLNQKLVLTCSYLGYVPAEISLEQKHKMGEMLVFPLSPKRIEQTEVEYSVKVESDIDKLDEAVTSAITLNPVALRTLPSLGAQPDLLRTIQMMPGVKATSEVSSALFVRGASSGLSLIQLDQAPLYNPSHFFGLFSTFHTDAVKHIQLLKGGFPAEYGGRSGSVLDVITKDGNRSNMSGLFSFSPIASKLMVQGPLPAKRGSYNLAARRTFFEPMLQAYKQTSSDFNDLPSYYFYDVNAKLNVDIRPQQTVTLSGYEGRDYLNLDLSEFVDRTRYKLHWGNGMVALRYRGSSNRETFFSGYLLASQYQSGFEYKSDEVVVQAFDNRFDDIGIRLDWEYHGFRQHSIKTGIEIHRYDFDLIQRNENVNIVDLGIASFNAMFYAQDSWKVHPRWQILAGSRLGWYERGPLFHWDPRLSILYKLTDNMNLKGSVGRYNQWLNVFSPGQGVTFFDVWVPNDGSIKPMYADHFIASFDYKPAAEYSFTVETYLNNFHSINVFNHVADRSEESADAFINGKGVSYGTEFMLQKHHGRLTGWIGYTLAWTWQRFPGSPLSYGYWYRPRWDRLNDFVLASHYQVNKTWDVSCSWRYQSGQGYTPAVGLYPHYTPPAEEHAPGEVILYGGRNSKHFDADHRLDVSVTWKHSVFRHPARLVFTIYNVYNHRSVWFRHSYFEDSEEDSPDLYKERDILLLPVFPLFRWEIEL